MDTSLSLGQRIRYYRKKAGLSQKKCAELAEVKPPALNFYEKDKREPSILVLVSLAKVLNVTVDALAGLKPPSDFIALNSDESSLLRIFRNLNDLGQDRVLEITSGLLEIPKYTNIAKRPPKTRT